MNAHAQLVKRTDLGEGALAALWAGEGRAAHEMEKFRATNARCAYEADCLAGNVNVMVVPPPTVLEA